MIEKMIQERNLPLLPKAEDLESWEKKRQKILETLCYEEYGEPVPAPEQLFVQVSESIPGILAGKADYTKLVLTAQLPGGEFSFPVHAMVPRSKTPVPAFVFLNFNSRVPDFYLPSEEICDGGFAVFSFGYEEVTPDNDDFSAGLAGVLGPRTDHSAGKISMWAWAAMRVMDYVSQLSFIDTSRVAVVGHSRLGKTALLAGALDPRFALVISNESGSCGAALSRAKKGENIERITSVFPHWFCPAFTKYADREESLPFDQHFLLALTSPRWLYVSSAAEDLWADPVSEFLSCVAASAVWEQLGMKGFCTPDHLPQEGECLTEGHIGYHLRSGEHYLSREDWQKFMQFFRGIRSI